VQRGREGVALTKPKILIGLFALLLFAWFGLGSIAHLPKSAPEETFTTIAGKKIALQDWRGKPVIVTFWATDCPSCMKEITHLIDLYRQFHQDGLEMIAVAMAYDPPNHVVEMTRARQLPYHVALDLNSAHALAFGGVKFTPTTFLISPEGKIADQAVGIFDYSSWQGRIAGMLNKG
jgi:peroxiredoxin